ncbi:hypothetical protein IJ670_03705 [bacterium]|nr:hypothetical protein [bacterium]
MKKLLLLCGIIALSCTASLAYYNEGELTDIDTLRRDGYSESMLQSVDFAKYHQSGHGTTYVRHFKHKDEIKKSKIGRAYSALKQYFDPAQDDGYFGNRQIEFSNTWRGDAVHYSSELVPVEQQQEVENL